MSERSEFTGGVLACLFFSLLFFLSVTFTFSLTFPWVYAAFERWIARNTVIDGRSLVFTGTGSELFWHYLLWLILTVVTFGIYGFWLFIKLTAWKVRHTHFADTYRP